MHSNMTRIPILRHQISRLHSPGMARRSFCASQLHIQPIFQPQFKAPLGRNSHMAWITPGTRVFRAADAVILLARQARGVWWKWPARPGLEAGVSSGSA
jgi:hypothetical protein